MMLVRVGQGGLTIYGRGRASGRRNLIHSHSVSQSASPEVCRGGRVCVYVRRRARCGATVTGLVVVARGITLSSDVSVSSNSI